MTNSGEPMIYGPNTLAVQAIIDRIQSLTEDECKRLNAAWNAARDAARSASWRAARSASWRAAIDASWRAARNAAWRAAIDAARSAAWYAAWSAARDATLAAVTYDLATDDGPYTIAQRDLLLAPWVSVCGMPKGLIAHATLAGEG